MEQVIYADVLFIVNFSMDFLSLYVTARIAHIRARPLPLCFGAALGALYATVSLFADTSGAVGLVINAAVAWLMCYVALSSDGILPALKQACILYGVGFLLGGVMTALYNLLGRLSSRFAGRTAVINGDVNTLTSSIPFPVFLFLGILTAVISLIFGRLYDKKKSAPNAELEITLGRRNIKTTALCDSGNLIRDPLGGLPIIFITRKKAAELFSSELMRAVSGNDPDAISNLPDATAKRIRAVPIRSVTSSSLAFAVKPDRIWVNQTEKSACICCTGEDSYGGCEALLPTSLL